MKTIYFGATSLDGYIADKNNSLEWLFQFGPPEEGLIENFLSGVGAIAMGSTTYQWIYDNQVAQDPDKKWPYTVPCYIFTSRKLVTIPNADIRFVSGDVASVHKEMVSTAKGKNVWLMGGGELVGQFHDAGLVDELQLTVVSVTLGGGAPVFPRHIKKPFKLKKARQMGTDAVELTYEVVK